MRSRACVVVAIVALSGTGCWQDQLNQGAARLAVMAAGQVAGLASADDGCGFGSLSTMLLGVAGIAPTDDGNIEAKWSIDECRVGSEQLAVAQTDCVGNQMFVRGLATVSAQQVIDAHPGIPPTLTDSHAVHVTVTTANLFELTSFQMPADGSDPPAKATFHRGTLSAVIEPALGESASAPGTYSVPTPVARISHVKLSAATMTIEAEGNKIDLAIDDSDITATTGPFDGATNTIKGTIVVDGESVDVDGALQPDFDIQKLNETYACEKDLAGPVT